MSNIVWKFFVEYSCLAKWAELGFRMLTIVLSCGMSGV